MTKDEAFELIDLVRTSVYEDKIFFFTQVLAQTIIDGLLTLKEGRQLCYDAWNCSLKQAIGKDDLLYKIEWDEFDEVETNLTNP